MKSKALTKAQQRKQVPLFTGLVKYFPDALWAVAKCSQAGYDQHEYTGPMVWDRSKSSDEHDALLRHLFECGVVDDDEVRHSAKVAWRALAMLQKELEENGEAPLSPHNVKRKKKNKK